MLIRHAQICHHMSMKKELKTHKFQEKTILLNSKFLKNIVEISDLMLYICSNFINPKNSLTKITTKNRTTQKTIQSQRFTPNKLLKIKEQ
jgi:hypothetical protein